MGSDITQPGNQSAYVRSLIDYPKYPIDQPGSALLESAISKARHELRNNGCAVIRNFFSGAGLEILLDESHRNLANAYFGEQTDANPYFTEDDPSWPQGHPRRFFMKRSNGFITTDCFAADGAAKRLYYWPPLTQFIKRCLEKDNLYIYEDPVGSLVVNVSRPGGCFNWHFDTNEFTITMMLQPARSGGGFEYAPNIRTTADECYAEVARVLRDESDRVVKLDLRPGDLQLFLGRFSLHRVTENTGDSDRLVMIMSFAEKPGMIGRRHRIQYLYGKTTDRHLEAEEKLVRNDALAD